MLEPFPLEMHPHRPSHPIRPRPRVLRAGWILGFLSCAVFSVRGADLPVGVTLDFPLATNKAMPLWLGQPETPASVFATLNLPVMTPDPTAALLVTVYFQEKQGGLLRITWKGTQGAQVLSDNFYENIGMANQRSLLIPAATLVGDGTLAFQCGDSSLSIQRIKLEWLASKSALVSPEVQDLLVTPSSGTTAPAPSFNGQPAQPQPAAWQDDLVNVPLSDQPVRIEEGVEFNVDLDNVPPIARLSLKESGLPLGKHLGVWINQQRAGSITPAVPDLTDDGFVVKAGAPMTYVGWRDGSFYVPVTFLKAGINTLEFTDEDESATGSTTAATSPAATEQPLALKDIVLQLNYQTPADAASVSQPQLLLGPVEPLSPSSPSISSETHTP